MIISDKYDEVDNLIQANLDRGITVLDGHGFYSKKRQRSVIRCCQSSAIDAVQRIDTVVQKHL